MLDVYLCVACESHEESGVFAGRFGLLHLVQRVAHLRLQEADQGAFGTSEVACIDHALSVKPTPRRPDLEISHDGGCCQNLRKGTTIFCSVMMTCVAQVWIQREDFCL